MGDPYFKEAFATITASRWTLLMARLFGKKRFGHDGKYAVKLSFWRGKYYLLEFKEPA